MKKINLILSSLALIFTLSPMAQAEDAGAAAESDNSAASAAPRWVCESQGKKGGFQLMCRAICTAEDGEKYRPVDADGEVVLRWECPNSDARERCSSFGCSSVSECEEEGVTGYETCHRNSNEACANQAQSATNARCVPPEKDAS